MSAEDRPSVAAMNSTEQFNAFLAHARSLTFWFTESNSSLSGLLEHLRNSKNKPKRFSNFRDALSKCANPNDARLGKYKPAIESLVAVWGTAADYQRALATSKAMTLVNEVKAQLVACKNYACNDVKSFPQCVNTALPKSDQDRIKGAKQQRTGMPISCNGTWNTVALRQAYDNVKSHQAGECTNYAYYAGHILSQGRTTPKPRIEIVSWAPGVVGSAHCYVVVGRTGDTPKGMLPPVNAWNNDCVIVDCWALTLGHDCVYNKFNYEFDTMMYPVKLLMDSTRPHTGEKMNVQGGLRRTGRDTTK
jgi:hypothetical protein